ncbi:MAG: hypothetical protein PHR47_03550 [Candidatus Pacebacteria bacterium]|nr:hypothetical protein [Candidatus Paceibacterota bacterium]
MDKKPTKLHILFFVFLLSIICFSYAKFIIFKDYYIKIEVPCNPETENCFVFDCDKESDDCKKFDYYKLIKKKAYSFPQCNQDLSNCSYMECNKDVCEEIFCDESNVSEGEHCNKDEK